MTFKNIWLGFFGKVGLVDEAAENAEGFSWYCNSCNQDFSTPEECSLHERDCTENTGSEKE